MARAAAIARRRHSGGKEGEKAAEWRVQGGKPLTGSREMKKEPNGAAIVGVLQTGGTGNAFT